MQSIADTSPPEYIAVNGKQYQCNVDYRVWAQILLMAQENLYDATTSEAQVIHNLTTFADMQKLAFNRVIPEPAMDTLQAMFTFMRGYPRENNGYNNEETETGAKTYSFKHDMNLILLAIRNQSGIDLSYRRISPFHWWLFLLEFQSLTSEHLIVNVMAWRGYEGNDKEMIKRRNRVALPKEYTRSELAMQEQLQDMFYNT